MVNKINLCVLIFGFQALSEEERFYLLSEQMNNQDVSLAQDVSIATLAKQTAALSASALANLIKKTNLWAVMR